MYEFEFDGSHMLDRFQSVWLLWARIVCTCGWDGPARWASAAGLDQCTDDLFRHQAEAATGRPQ
jgi:hypothetical protein